MGHMSKAVETTLTSVRTGFKWVKAALMFLRVYLLFLVCLMAYKFVLLLS